MTARILNGIAIRDQIYAELQSEIASLAAQGVRPGLAAVLVGDNPASKLYVNSKIAACEKLGLASFHVTPPASTTTEELLAIVSDLNIILNGTPPRFDSFESSRLWLIDPPPAWLREDDPALAPLEV